MNLAFTVISRYESKYQEMKTAPFRNIKLYMNNIHAKKKSPLKNKK